MLENIWTEYLKEQLADRLRGYIPPDKNYQSLPDRWIAMSLLQKAIRRGDKQQALRAGRYLLNADYRMLWRRLVVIAWEDISFGDFDLCGMVTAASGSKRWRAKFGGEWRVASYLISALCKAQKNRITDDILVIAEHDFSLVNIRDRLGTAETSKLRSIAFGSGEELSHRVIASWYLLGTDKYGSDFLYRRKGDVDRFFSSFEPPHCREHVTSICRIALSRSGTILPAVAALLWEHWLNVQTPPKGVMDQLGPVETIGGIPRYAFDGNTRAGRRYLYGLSEQTPDLKAYLYDVSFADRKALLRKLYFRTHSSLCANRQLWSVSDDIRDKANQIGFGLSAQTINEGKRILSAALLSHPMTEAHL
ncbi:MAG: hypothetical protein ABJ275_03085 [Maricaulaceae bacterium]